MAPKHPRRSADTLASVIKETAPAGVLDIMRRNERFVMPGGLGWVVMVVNPADLGGLSQRMRSNADKGSLIEQINNGHIDTLATEQMLADEQFAIIPTASTLEVLSEYSMMTGEMPYTWALVTQTPGTGELVCDPLGKGYYDQAVAVATGSVPLAEVLDACSAPDEPVTAAEWDEGDAEASDAQSPGSADPEILDETAMWEPLDQDEAAEYEGEAEADDDSPEAFVDSDVEVHDTHAGVEWTDGGDELVDDEVDDLTDQTVSAGDQAPAEASGTEASLVEPETAVAPQAVAPAVSTSQIVEQMLRNALDEDLGLDLGVANFEAAFDTTSVPQALHLTVPAQVSDWLGTQVEELTGAASQAIRSQRELQNNDLRTLYVELMAKHVEEVSRKVSLTAEGSKFKEAHDRLNTVRSSLGSQVAERVLSERKRLTEEYERALEEAGQAGAAAARANYDAKHRGELKVRLDEAEARVRTGFETQVADQQRVLMDKRRASARELMHSGHTAVLSVLREHRVTQDAELKAEMETWRTRVEALVNDHRAEDVARVETLAAEQATIDKVQRVREEFEAEVATLRAQADARVQRAEERLAAQREAAEYEASQTRTAWQAALDEANARAISEAQRVAEFADRFEKAATTYETRDRERITALEAEKKNWFDDLERQNTLQARSNRVALFLVVTLGLLALLVGFILGVGYKL